jgi:hypothetical protein
MTGLLVACATFLVAVSAALLVDWLIGRRVDPELREAAETIDAWPIATIRGRPGDKVVLHHRSGPDHPAGFVVLSAGRATPISADELRRLWNTTRLRWYRPLGHLGMRQFKWYVSANPDELAPSALEQPAPRWVVVALLALVCILIAAVALLVTLDLRA